MRTLTHCSSPLITASVSISMGSSDHGHAGIFSVPCVHGFQAHVLNHLTKADGPSIEARHSMAHTKVRDTHFSCVLESW
ncbi:hypothetical protein Mp_7g08980 [Marchantia polymorpha subsp. ruderalis]|uniref:Uncharacterized protein n=2 Tax=Marchantia polymorpha TaxID=3197 RepID=A0AAF6BXM0_MARPO|nr:hypothetical protein MARPO_0068s0051 [Marchantia polymorpha]BBN16754.1 hypothetical protein Mp_7g08980 [Marchantia polymorpha subsp. ruderalis]|eukprot:PTQ35836.1 hypothetical protein MARPO_0068s0051 [Marchantia polymorpha]